MDFRNYLEQGYEFLLAIPNYFTQVYTGYGYLYKASTEIAWEQVGLDSAQDGILDSGFEEAIKLGHSANEIKISKCCSGGFLHHLKSHLVQKTTAAIIFPWIAPFLNNTYLNNIPGKSLITEGAELSGINPLEGLYSISSIPRMILGENNTISNIAEFFTFHDIFNVEKAKDLDFNQYIKFFKSYMEFVDAYGHTIREFSTLYNNRHLASIPLKTYAYLRIKLGLYYNTKEEEALNDKRIEELSLQNQDSAIKENSNDDEGICLNHEDPAWTNYLYENKWNIGYKLLTEIALAKTFTAIYTRITSIDWKSYFPKSNNPSDPTNDTKPDYHKCSHEDCKHSHNKPVLLWGDLGKQGLEWIIPSIKTDDQMLQEVTGTFVDCSGEEYTQTGQQIIYESTTARTDPTMARAFSCPEFQGEINLVATPSPSKKMMRASSTHIWKKSDPLFDGIKEESDLGDNDEPTVLKPIPQRRTSETSKSALGNKDDGRDEELLPSPLDPPQEIEFCLLCTKQDGENEEHSHQNDPNADSLPIWLAKTIVGKCTDPNCDGDH